jgi:hypothetical protein
MNRKNTSQTKSSQFERRHLGRRQISKPPYRKNESDHGFTKLAKLIQRPVYRYVE